MEGPIPVSSTVGESVISTRTESWLHLASKRRPDFGAETYSTALPVIIHCYTDHEARTLLRLQDIVAREVGTRCDLVLNDIARVVAAIRLAGTTRLLGELNGNYKTIYVVIRGRWTGFFLTW